MEIKFKLKDINEYQLYEYISDLRNAVESLTDCETYRSWDIDHTYYSEYNCHCELKRYNDEPSSQSALYLGFMYHELMHSTALLLLNGTIRMSVSSYPQNNPQVAYLVTASWKASPKLMRLYDDLSDETKTLIEMI